MITYKHKSLTKRLSPIQIVGAFMQNVDALAQASGGSPPPMLIGYGTLDQSKGYE
jgi:hypothetical protein